MQTMVHRPLGSSYHLFYQSSLGYLRVKVQSHLSQHTTVSGIVGKYHRVRGAVTSETQEESGLQNQASHLQPGRSGLKSANLMLEQT